MLVMVRFLLVRLVSAILLQYVVQGRLLMMMSLSTLETEYHYIRFFIISRTMYVVCTNSPWRGSAIFCTECSYYQLTMCIIFTRTYASISLERERFDKRRHI